LSRDPDGLARCCQKEYSLTRDPGSSQKVAKLYLALNLAKKLKKEKSCKPQASSNKQLDNRYKII
jgi:hypothetical protein